MHAAATTTGRRWSATSSMYHASCNAIAIIPSAAGSQVTVVADVDAVAERLVTLKALYQNADIFAMVAARPKLLLQSVDQIQEDGRKVRARGGECGPAGWRAMRGTDRQGAHSLGPGCAACALLQGCAAYLRCGFSNAVGQISRG